MHRSVICYRNGTWLDVRLVPGMYKLIVGHWNRDNMDAISQTFSSPFSWNGNVWISMKISLKLFLKFKFTTLRHWSRKRLGANQARSHFLDRWWLVYRCIYASLSLKQLIYLGSDQNPSFYKNTYFSNLTCPTKTVHFVFKSNFTESNRSNDIKLSLVQVTTLALLKTNY